ncbi:hypothetical protein E4634_04670 [Mangrovimicrobium sediminis]|uniref:Porin n=1 Tax=Mangrovimicrobium sediminis TaxID=2562682 RepID=A0A4Z0M796_9GAMM|nr:hypothetical protein [Haliea sp. SAOS-164]TGD75290.1 hypothetical protein E4634_04670 [Haliea sp. SAOS-164]
MLAAGRTGILAFATLILMLAGSGAVAMNPFSVQGFGTLGAVYNTTDNAGFIRDLGQPKGATGWETATDSMVGLQLAYRPNEKFEAVIQGVSRYSYDDTFQPRVSWAFIKYQLTPDVAVRAGRLGWDAYMLADSRNIGYSYLWVRPPIEYFGALQFSHLDGADIEVRHAFGETIASFKLYVGQADEKLPLLDDGDLFDLKGIEAYGAHLGLQTRNWSHRIGASLYHNPNSLPPPYSTFTDLLRATDDPLAPGFANDFDIAGSDTYNVNYSVAYDNGGLQAQFLANLSQSNKRMISDHYQLLGLLGYRIGQFTPYLIYTGTWLYNFDDSVDLSPDNPLYFAGELLIESTDWEQHSWKGGVRFDFMPKAALKLQVEHIQSEGYPSYWRDVKPGWDGDADVFSLTVDFIF